MRRTQLIESNAFECATAKIRRTRPLSARGSDAGAVGIGVVLFVEGEDGFGGELGRGVLLELLADLVDFGGEADEDIRHGVGNFLGIADDDALTIAQHDVGGDADDGGVVGDIAQDDGAGADAAVVADGDIAKDFGAGTDDDVVEDGRVTP